MRSTETCVFGQNHRTDFGLIARRETDEPGMVFVLGAGFILRSDLGRSRLAADVEAVNTSAAWIYAKPAGARLDEAAQAAFCGR